MKKIALSEAKDQLSKYLHDAEKEEIVILRHGKPAGVLIGFGSEDDWFDYRLENDPRFLARVEQARESLQAGRGVRFEDVGESPRRRSNKRLQPARTNRATPATRRRARG
jgi:prevent-host-death family protein